MGAASAAPCMPAPEMADASAFDSFSYAMGESAGEVEEVWEEPDPIIAVRSNFNPLANFTPSLQVDEHGKATIDVAIPDNLTRYRFEKSPI